MDLIPAKKIIPEYPTNCHMRAIMIQYITTVGSVIHPLFRKPSWNFSNKTFIVPTFGLYIHVHRVAVTTNERPKGNK